MNYEKEWKKIFQGYLFSLVMSVLSSVLCIWILVESGNTLGIIFLSLLLTFNGGEIKECYNKAKDAYKQWQKRKKENEEEQPEVETN